ncbi:MAG TPA: GNAT family N-acetyltransferase [Burkholderiaceae bacterium]|nr:GNAT family N-acetyltransferase [Burkholderiaceae bacterium]
MLNESVNTPGAAAGTSNDATVLREARAEDMPAVLAIYNAEVRNSTSTYQYAERTLDEQLALLSSKQAAGDPFVLAELADGSVGGYATYGPFRPREGWRFTVEHSVYLREDCRGRGLARPLMRHIMAHARARGFHSMVGVVDASNTASIRMHQAMGFQVAGVMREGGYKFDRWLDCAFLQALL